MDDHANGMDGLHCMLLLKTNIVIYWIYIIREYIFFFIYFYQPLSIRNSSTIDPRGTFIIFVHSQNSFEQSFLR